MTVPKQEFGNEVREWGEILPVNLRPYLEEKRPLIEEHLRRYVTASNRVPARLIEAMCYSLLAPGKRLRPLLALMAAEAVGGNGRAALPAACAIEMVHAYSLVHDDLPAMDDDDVRRGQPTCHKRFDEATAILVGDALLTLAFQVLSEDVHPAELAVQCCRELATAAGVAGMVGGQMDDLLWEKRDGGKLEDLEAIHRRKTGALFHAALRMGGLIGFHDGKMVDRQAPVLDALDRYATALGLAFQISDDLLDATGSPEKTGKKVKKDAVRGKLTFPVLLGVAESRRRLIDCCQDAQRSLAPLGDAGRYLAGLVRFILERDR